MPFSSYSVASGSSVASRCSQLYRSAVLLYLAELDQLPGIDKADHAQLCQVVSQTLSGIYFPPTTSTFMSSCEAGQSREHGRAQLATADLLVWVSVSLLQSSMTLG